MDRFTRFSCCSPVVSVGEFACFPSIPLPCYCMLKSYCNIMHVPVTPLSPLPVYSSLSPHTPLPPHTSFPPSLHTPHIPTPHRETGPRCPVDNTRISHHQLFKDNFARREVLSLNVCCSANECGCAWHGELRDLEVIECSMLSIIQCRARNNN